MSLYDPASSPAIGAAILTELQGRPLVALGSVPRFHGPGIYALYYAGPHPAYAPLAAANMVRPGSWAVYIGRAESDASRKGLVPIADATGTRLYTRIRQHAATITAATDLAIADFHIRYLPMVSHWIGLGETAAIQHHQPVWNVLVDGLGNNDPGSKRTGGKRSRWDTLHPGRPWATVQADRPETAADIAQDVAQYLAARMPRT